VFNGGSSFSSGAFLANMTVFKNKRNAETENKKWATIPARVPEIQSHCQDAVCVK
jgi:hypothetical protein